MGIFRPVNSICVYRGRSGYLNHYNNIYQNKSNFIDHFRTPLEFDYNNAPVNNIHFQFLNYIYFFNKVEGLETSKIQANQNALNTITNETEFIAFCETSHGVYYKCCLWAKNADLTSDLSIPSNLLEKHHILLHYLYAPPHLNGGGAQKKPI